MSRPNSISIEDIARWNHNVNNDPNFPKFLTTSQIIMEVVYAGFWLCEELEKLECPSILITRIQETAGRLSFGRDPWDVSNELLHAFINNNLNYEEDDGLKN